MPEAQALVRVTVVGGDLGAGKTSLLNHLLRTTSQPIAVIVNDFGALGIDQDLVEHSDGTTIALANGCICCSLADGFASALRTIADLDDGPERLVVEASGVADPGQIAAYAHAPGLALDSVVVVVDAAAVRERARDRYVGDVVLRQLHAADLLVVNKVDLVSSDELAELHRWLTNAYSGVPRLDTVDARVEPALLLDTPTHGREHRPSPDHSDTASAYQTWAIEVDAPVCRSRLDEFLAALPDGVYRAKGIVRLSDDPDNAVVLHLVGRRRSLERFDRWSDGPSRIVAIGRPGAIDDAWLRTQLTPDDPE
ncbi:MAG: GTP-binding protein [Acidimicrobiales bacterium]|nr:GTP-binding protein [Acidimicrobiales bacterium]